MRLQMDIVADERYEDTPIWCMQEIVSCEGVGYAYTLYARLDDTDCPHVDQAAAIVVYIDDEMDTSNPVWTYETLGDITDSLLFVCGDIESTARRHIERTGTCPQYRDKRGMVYAARSWFFDDIKGVEHNV